MGRADGEIPRWVWRFRWCVQALPGFPGKARVVNRIGGHVRGRGYEAAVPARYGGSFRLDLDDWVSFQIFAYGCYEENETRFLLDILRPGMIVLDIGAHVGYYTILAGLRVSPGGAVHAFEPMASSYSRLLENVTLNQLDNVTANHCAVSDRAERATLWVGDPLNTGMSGLSRDEGLSGRKEEVRAVTIDGYLDGLRIRRVDVVKIDIQGAEHAALVGMKQTLRSNEQVQVLAEVDPHLLGLSGTSAPALFQTLRTLGFRAYRIGRFGIRPIPESAVSREALVLFRR